jgi:cytochrome c-type biogenesis protein CcmH/NrfF
MAAEGARQQGSKGASEPMVGPTDEAVILSDRNPHMRTKGVEGSVVAFRRLLAAKWFRMAQASLLAVAICFSLGATDAGSRFNDLGHRLMCTCGCAQLLGECNHVGCPESGRMRDELTSAIASGLSDQAILDGFSNKYGVTVLAAPPTHGFDLVAWIAPFAVFAAALVGTILLVRRWGGLGKDAQARALATAPANPEEQSRLERIRRETGMGAGSDGGF